jgi:hypothetical protein
LTTGGYEQPTTLLGPYRARLWGESLMTSALLTSLNPAS